MLAYAQELVYNLKELMPTQYQKDNFDAMLGLFLSAQGYPLPEHSKTKSPSALSRFLNINPWSTRDMIRIVRSYVLETVLNPHSAGRLAKQIIFLTRGTKKVENPVSFLSQIGNLLNLGNSYQVNRHKTLEHPT